MSYLAVHVPERYIPLWLVAAVEWLSAVPYIPVSQKLCMAACLSGEAHLTKGVHGACYLGLLRMCKDGSGRQWMWMIVDAAETYCPQG